MNLLQMSFSGAAFITAVVIIRAVATPLLFFMATLKSIVALN